MSKGKGGSKAPTIDYNAMGQSQTDTNVRTAQAQAALGNVNTFSPYGSSQYVPYTDPTTGQTRYNLTQSLSPGMQNLFGSQQSLAQYLAEASGWTGQVGTGVTSPGQAILTNLATPAANAITGNLDLSAVNPVSSLTPGSFRTNVAQGPVQTSVSGDFPALVKQAQDAAYKSQTQYLDPQFAQARQNLATQLADEGLQPGTQAYDRAMGDLGRQQNQAYQSAQSAAVEAGNEQQRALYDQALRGGQFANQAQQQLFGQGLSLADLYNQAVLGASGQNLQAMQANLGRAQAVQQAPIGATEALSNIGSQMFQTGLGGIAQALQGVNLVPMGGWQIPTSGAAAPTVAPVNLADIARAQTSAAQVGQEMQRNQLGSMLGIGNFASQMLTGQGLTGLFGSGGLLGSTGLFGAGSGAGDAAMMGALGGDFGGGGAALGVADSAFLPFLA